MSLRRAILGLTCTVALAPAVQAPAQDKAAQEKPARIIAGIASANRLFEDLEMMVVELAGKKKSWEDNVYPNLEVFTIEVELDRPVRQDRVFDPTIGQHKAFIIPVLKKGLRPFLDDNLAPIGIDAKRIAAKTTPASPFYDLTGDVFPEGTKWFLRHQFDTAVITQGESEIPKDMADPSLDHKGLLDGENSYDLVVQMLTTKEDAASRAKSIEKLRKELDSSLESPRDDESPAAFKLRKRIAEQSLGSFEQFFTQSQRAFFGLSTSAETKTTHGDIIVTALEGTELAKIGENLGKTPSYFAGIVEPKDPVLTGRVNLAIDPKMQKRISDFAELSEPVGHERIDKEKKTTPEQKAARKKIESAILQIVGKNATLGVWDGLAEVTKQDSGTHVLIMAVKASDDGKLKSIVEQLPNAHEGYTVKTSAEKIGDVEVHHVTRAKQNDVAKKFWGSTDLYLAAGPDAIWMAKGQGGLEVLKAYIGKLGEKPADAATGRLAHLRFHAKPILEVNESFWEEMNIDLTKSLESMGLGLKKKDEPKKAVRPGQKEGKSTQAALKDYKWAEVALPAMDGKVDVIELTVDKTDKAVEGKIDVQTEVLKALGTVIADFADKNLGQQN
jgi:hypothetical protein